MAFAITRVTFGTPTNFVGLSIPGNAASGGPTYASGSTTALAVAAAATTNDAIQNMGVTCSAFRAVTYLQSVAGTSTISVALQVSSSATFASDVNTVDVKFVNAATGNAYVLELKGEHALVAGAQYVRLQYVTGTGTSATADAAYFAAPSP